MDEWFMLYPKKENRKSNMDRMFVWIILGASLYFATPF